MKAKGRMAKACIGPEAQPGKDVCYEKGGEGE